MPLETRTLDPNSTLDFAVDWTDWLAGDTIETSSWVIPPGLTRVSDTSTPTTGIVFLTGGAVGRRYRVVNRIMTTLGRIEDRSFEVLCQEH